MIEKENKVTIPKDSDAAKFIEKVVASRNMGIKEIHPVNWERLTSWHKIKEIKFDFDLLANDTKKALAYEDNIRTAAGIVGISTATLSRVHRGCGKLQIDTILMMCKYLNTPITKYILVIK